MAFLDVTQPLLDPDFTDTFDVIRRQEVIGDNGRSSVVPLTLRRQLGVVTATSPNDLQRQDNYQSMSRSISIVCKLQLRGETSDAQPDLVVWRGSQYLVKHVDPYPQFGPGFWQAECSSVEKVDPEFAAPLDGKAAFNGTSFTNLIPLLG